MSWQKPCHQNLERFVLTLVFFGVESRYHPFITLRKKTIMALNYKASGRLLASSPLLGSHQDLVLVDLTPGGAEQSFISKYVVAFYTEGNSERGNGHYFSTFSKAYAYYVGELFESLPVCDMDTHPKLAASVKKADKYFDVLSAGKKTKTKAAK